MTNLEIAALPVSEKLQLMESLWDSICREPSVEAGMPSWHKEVLAERLRRFDLGDEPVSAWSEARKRIREQTGGQ